VGRADDEAGARWMLCAAACGLQRTAVRVTRRSGWSWTEANAWLSPSLRSGSPPAACLATAPALDAP